ncbi:DUF6291 domain-containing protein [Butyrivibrio sp. LC3010]|uniref:DUF6291 domain-containing protein n=1 Tax=Butyrivibrio sp. LC3010 TaxID=1280680 RepID=UPI00047C819B|nr:DUF6291 domain-containing protein [Butyrivibrio sp. LC3010]
MIKKIIPHKPAKWFPCLGAWEAQLALLTDEQVGILLKSALNYLNTGECPSFDDQLLAFAFSSFADEIQKSQAAFDKKRLGGQKGGINSGIARSTM